MRYAISFKVLVVDDEHSICLMLARFLSRHGCDVVIASSGAEAISKVSTESFSMMFCDVMMPGMGGIETLTEIRRLNHFLPVVMMSGFADHDVVVRALEIGSVDFVAKPLNLSQVTAIMQKLLHPEIVAPVGTASPIFNLLRESYVGTLRMINHLLEAKNPYLNGHAERVAAYSVRLAHVLQLPDGQIEVLNCAALLHDIGKIGIQDSILLKPGKLDEDEWCQIKTHSLIGRKMVEELKLFRAEEPIIEHHHEHYDGTGYPGGLCKEAIPLCARIVSIADAYDAMTSTRPYRDALTPALALDVIAKDCGTQFDPMLGAKFLIVINSDECEK